MDRVDGVSGELVLRRRGPHYEIIANGVFLMATYDSQSEEALVYSALGSPLRAAGATPGHGNLRVLIAGLGMGRTLRAALAFPHVAEVEVVEIEPRIVDWNRGPLAQVNGRALGDPRVLVTCEDFARRAERLEAGSFDLIALDTDNGPDWLVRQENARLYTRENLARLHGALRDGGALTLWSSERSPALRSTLEGLFAAVTEEEFRSTLSAGREGIVYVYVARRAVTRGGASRIR